MSRTLTIEKTVFKYEELSDSAKEKAREEHGLSLWNDGVMHERMEEIAEWELQKVGLTYESGSMHYSLYSPGGEPRFAASGTMKLKGRPYGVNITVRGLGGSSSVMDVDVLRADGEYAAASVHQKIKAKVHDLSYIILKAMYEDDEYMTSDEELKESSEANGYEYDEAGHLA